MEYGLLFTIAVQYNIFAIHEQKADKWSITQLKEELTSSDSVAEFEYFSIKLNIRK